MVRNFILGKMVFYLMWVLKGMKKNLLLIAILYSQGLSSKLLPTITRVLLSTSLFPFTWDH